MKPKGTAEAIQHSQTLVAHLKSLSKQHEQVLEAYEARLETLLADAAKNASGVPGKRPAPLTVPEGPDSKRQRLLNEREARRRAIWDDCARLVEKCRRHSKAEPFKVPVDPIKLKIPDYYNIIKRPMDLSTVASKLKRGEYSEPKEVATDVRQIWANCRGYNPPQTPVAKMGEAMSEFWERNWASSNAEQRWAMELAREAHEDKVLSGTMSDAGDADLASRLRDMRIALGDFIAARDHLDGVTPGTLPKTLDTGRAMSFEERRRLSAHLCSLASEKLQAVLEIVAGDVNATKDAASKVEITLDDLSDATLWRLREYVDAALAPPGPPPKKGTPARPGGPADKRPAAKAAPPPAAGAGAPRPPAPAKPTPKASTPAQQGGADDELTEEAEGMEEGEDSQGGVVGSTAVGPERAPTGPPVFGDTGTVAQSGTNRGAQATFIKPKPKAESAKAEVDPDKWADLGDGGADGGAAAAAAGGGSGGGAAANGGAAAGDDDLWSDWQKKAAKEEEKMQRQKEEEARRKAEEEENKRKLEEMEQQQEAERQQALEAEKAAQRAELESMRNRAGLAEDGGAGVPAVSGDAGGGDGGGDDGGGGGASSGSGGGTVSDDGDDERVLGEMQLRAKQDDDDDMEFDGL